MHPHDQGPQEGCRWCTLDLLLHELAAETSASNLDGYLRVEMFSIYNSESRRWEEELRRVEGEPNG
jgi:hypothetical protein